MQHSIYLQAIGYVALRQNNQSNRSHGCFSINEMLMVLLPRAKLRNSPNARCEVNEMRHCVSEEINLPRVRLPVSKGKRAQLAFGLSGNHI